MGMHSAVGRHISMLTLCMKLTVNITMAALQINFADFIKNLGVLNDVW